MGKIKTIFVVASLMVAFATSGFSQDRGGITGTVTDPSGAAIPNGSVKVTNTARGEVVNLQTTAAGLYSATNLIHGSYSVTVEVPGFRTSTVSGVEVRIGEVARADIQLQVGELTEKVDVTAEALLLKSESSDIGTIVETESILNLPLQVGGSVRDPLAFAKLTPGFTGSTANSAIEFQTHYTINGGQSGATQILVDGADIALTSPQSQFNAGLSVEAVEEFKVMSSNFSAEYGRAIGGIVNLTLKSGTNDFHGSVYEFLRNDKLDARGFFSPERRVNRQNDFGFLGSGPVRIPKVYNGRDKTFFMFAYEGFRYRQGALNTIDTFPIDAFRQGDFSKLVDADGNQIPIYDPATTVVLPDGTVQRQQFSGNIIPSHRIDPVSTNVLSFVPPVNFPDRIRNNTYDSQQFTVDTNVYTTKVDHALTSRQKITVSYSQADEDDADVRPFGPVGGSSQILQHTKYARLSHDFVISPTTLNYIQFGFSRRLRKETPTYLGNYAEQIGLQGVGQLQFPYFVMPGYHFFGGDSTTFTVLFKPVDNAYQLNELFTKVIGKHTLKYGGELRKTQYNANSLGAHSGDFNFDVGQTGLPGSSQRTGDTFASFLIGAVSSSSYNPFGQDQARRFKTIGLFVQDDFKMTSRLTMNLGLRYDRFWPMSDATGRLSSFDPNTPNPGAGGLLGALIFAGQGPGRTGLNRFQEIYNKAFGPRFGLAYQLNPRTVLRAGYGIYYQELKATGWGGANEGFFTTVNYASPDGFTPVFNLDDGFPTDWPVPPFIDPTFANGRNVAYADPKSGRPPYAQNWQVSIQRQLRENLSIDAAYVATKGNHLITRNQIHNQVDPRYLSLGPLLDADIDSPEAKAAGIVNPWPEFSGPVRQALRPFPQYRNINLANQFGADRTGNSIYHAFQAKAQGRMRGGSFLLAYTFSKNLTDGSNTRDLDIFALHLGATQNGFNRRAERTLAALDVAHNLVINYIFDFPFGPGKRYLQTGVAAAILGGWSMGGVLTYQNGWPIETPLPASSRVPLFAGRIRPNRVPGVSALTDAAKGDFDPGRDLYLNPEAWTSPPSFQFGDAPRMAEVRVEPLLNEDISLLKSTPISEKVRIQFRAEAFNIFNRTQFGDPILDLGDPDFGRVFAQANRPRSFQFGLKVIF